MIAADVRQSKTVVSVPKDPFLEAVVTNKELSKKDLRVCMILLTELDGFHRGSKERDDPLNFRAISVENIADTLRMSKSDVKESIRNLIDYQIIQRGDSPTVKKGYRFKF